MDITTLIGTAGAALILCAFIANEFGKLDAKSFRYDLINLLGSGLLVWYALILSSWPFLILNTVWLLVSLRDVMHGLAGKRKNR